MNDTPDPETIKALMALEAERPIPSNIINFSETPEPDKVTNDGLVHDDPSVELSQPQVAVEGASPEPQLCEPRSFEELRTQISAHLATCRICRETPTIKYHCESAPSVPTLCVSEEFPLTVEPAPEPQLCAPADLPATLDLGLLPWSKRPIREISSLVWFKYEKEVLPIPGPETFTVYNVVDGNGRILFCVNEEGMANFFVNAANIYVQAGMSTQL